MTHQYAANHDQFPGHLGLGQTCQSIGKPEVLGEAKVGPPAARRNDTQPATRSTRKSAPRARRTSRS